MRLSLSFFSLVLPLSLLPFPPLPPVSLYLLSTCAALTMLLWTKLPLFSSVVAQICYGLCRFSVRVASLVDGAGGEEGVWPTWYLVHQPMVFIVSTCVLQSGGDSVPCDFTCAMKAEKEKSGRLGLPPNESVKTVLHHVFEPFFKFRDRRLRSPIFLSSLFSLVRSLFFCVS